jgi:hypothetical protein
MMMKNQQVQHEVQHRRKVDAGGRVFVTSVR